jgi:hypothetical protein
MICPWAQRAILIVFLTLLGVHRFSTMAFLPRRKRLTYYAQLKLVGKLDSNSGTPDVYILTKRETSEGERR